MDNYLESDPQRGSMAAILLGLLFAKMDRHPDAVTVLLDAALRWHQVSGNWDSGHLRILKQERAVIGEASFSQLVRANVSPDLLPSLESRLLTAEDT